MSPNQAPGSSENVPADQNEKLADAKKALKAKLMRAVMQQALQELGDATVIADFAFNQIRSNTSLIESATSALKDKIAKHIVQESALPFQDRENATNSMFEAIKKDTSIVAEATGALRNKLANHIKDFSISDMSDPAKYASGLFATLEKDAQEIDNAAQELSKLLDGYVSKQVVDQYADGPGKAEELAPAIVNSPITHSAVEALEKHLKRSILARTSESLSDANTVAIQLKEVLADSDVVKSAVASLREKLLEDVRAKTLDVLANSEQAAESARTKLGPNPDVLDTISKLLVERLVKEAAQSSVDQLSNVDQAANRARGMVSDTHPSVRQVREAVKTQLLKSVMDSALSELNGDLSTAASSITGSTVDLPIDQGMGVDEIPGIEILDDLQQDTSDDDFYDEVIEADFEAKESAFVDHVEIEEPVTQDIEHQAEPEFVQNDVYSDASSAEAEADQITSVDEDIFEEPAELADAPIETSSTEEHDVESSFTMEDLEEDPFGDLDFDEIDSQDAELDLDDAIEFESFDADDNDTELDSAPVDDLISDAYDNDEADEVSEEVRLFQQELQQLQENDPFATDEEEPAAPDLSVQDIIVDSGSEPEWQSINDYGDSSPAAEATFENRRGEPDLEADVSENEWALEEVSAPELDGQYTHDSTPLSGAEEESGDTVYYVYGVVSTDDSLEGITSISGIDASHTIKTTLHDDLVALISKVPAEAYGSEAVKNKMKDAEWLRNRVREHAAIVESLKSNRTLIPMRFCTVYDTESEISAMLESRYDHFSSLLARVRGKQEWALKIYRDKNLLQEKVRESEKKVEDSLGFISKGVVHFVKDEMNRLSSGSEKSIDLMSEHCATRSHAALLEHASEGINKPAMNDGSETGDVILNAAYLVPIGEEKGIQEELERLKSEYGNLGFEYELKGPWPPYHFVGYQGDSQSKVVAE